MDAPPPAQPDAAAPPSSTSASTPPSAPPPNPTPSVSTSSPAPTPAPAPSTAQTLEPATPSHASARPPPPPRMRPPYTHLASPITMSSSSSSPATTAASSSATPAMPRGGVAIGLPAHPRGPHAPAGYTGFVPPPPVAHQFSPLHRGPGQPPPPAPQLRQPAPGIQNIGMIGSINTSQLRPGGLQQPRPGLPSSATPSPSGGQIPGSQKTPMHSLTRPLSISPSTALQQTQTNASAPFRPQQRPQVPQQRPYQVAQSAPVASHQQNVVSGQQQLPQHQLLQQQQQQQQQHQSQPQSSLQQSQPQSSLPQSQQHATLKTQQQAAQTPVSLTQKADSPATQQATNTQLVDMASIDAAAGESSNRLLSKRSIRELLAQIDPSESLDPEVEDVLIDIAEDFIESVGRFSCSLAKHRKSSTLEAKDVLLHAERSWNITLPGFTGDEIKLYKKPHVNDIHRERLTLIKKSMASEGNTRSSAAQAASNQKNQTPKPPATGSP
ncbi:transcription initiation factor TFIID subunit 12 isoform X1 [Brachypodium distachyon]|uniref:Transcription initiation factor TFIID subunit 12 domain-containing protein n=1 Tax=Brachypodium distachyon TaxID=15368 RepID=A0A0Q3LHR2_BRADI|nr:transcription initiation factor TFIID subunit 12 isoform X1 [Brachypodium distachyon]KQJ92149.1 hypothetical protein BRADI_4g41936v3 [Brachypodium distachyon]|eukprot:XP_014758692.1 transcription initiation factor TFIID subunit 12 isoform X1 [Brachypodium distachyon]